VEYRFPLRVVARNSRRRRSRSCLEKDWSGRWHPCVFKGWRIGSYEPFGGRHQVGGLYTKPLAALGPPTAHDLSSTSRLHTSPKSVRSFSSNRAGLIGAFHGFFLLLSDRARMGLHTGLQFFLVLQRNTSASIIGESAVEGAGSIPQGITSSRRSLSGIGKHNSPPLSTSPAVSSSALGAPPSPLPSPPHCFATRSERPRC